MVIAREVDGAMQIIGRLKQRVHLADGLDARNMLSEEAMERGLTACRCSQNVCKPPFRPSSVCIVRDAYATPGAERRNFLTQAEKVIPFPIEIISGNERVRLTLWDMK